MLIVAHADGLSTAISRNRDQPRSAGSDPRSAPAGHESRAGLHSALRAARVRSPRHLLKPMSSQMKQVFGRSALEAVLAAAAERPPSKEASLGGLRRSFVTEPVKKCDV